MLRPARRIHHRKQVNAAAGPDLDARKENRCVRNRLRSVLNRRYARSRVVVRDRDRIQAGAGGRPHPGGPVRLSAVWTAEVFGRGRMGVQIHTPPARTRPGPFSSHAIQSKCSFLNGTHDDRLLSRVARETKYRGFGGAGVITVSGRRLTRPDRETPRRRPTNRWTLTPKEDPNSAIVRAGRRAVADGGDGRGMGRASRRRLRGLEYLSQFEAHDYDRLARPMQGRITETRLSCQIIDPGTPPEVILSVFKRWVRTAGSASGTSSR